MQRRLAAAVVIMFALAACDGDTASTTTTSSSTLVTSTTTTTTQPGGRVALTPNGPTLIAEGTRGPYVEALQYYLVCTGHEQPSPDGGTVSIDGVFGPITADAVAYYQAELRRVPSGEPDEETFASLARDCAQPRAVSFEIGESTVEVAGNTAPGDEDTLTLAGQAGQVLSIVVTEGDATPSVSGGNGTSLDGGAGGTTWEAELPATGDYTIRFAASSPTTYLAAVSIRSPNVVASDFGPMVLSSDGLGIAEFGDDPENTIAVIALVLGEPWNDTGWQEGVPGCTGSNRHVTWPIQLGPDAQSHPAALEVHFSDLGGTPFFAQYAYRSYDLSQLDPIARGLTTAEGFTLGTDLATFTDLYGAATFVDEVRGLTRFDQDMLAGFEAGEEPADRLAWYVGAGEDGCPDFQ